MSTEMQIAIVGVIGTLAGTFLGWLLNNLSLKGKLNFFVTTFEAEIKCRKNGVAAPSTSVGQSNFLKYRIELDLYNSSGTTKIIRNVKVVLLKKRKELASDTPQDSDTGHEVARMVWYNNVSPMNIPPKSIGVLRLHGGFYPKNKSLEYVYEADSVVLQYTNENNKIKKVFLKRINPTNYFENKTEDNQ